MRLYVSLAVAACYAPTVPAGVTCDPAAPVCPDQQTCVAVAGAFACEPPGFARGADAATPDVRLPDGPPGDRDGDGVPDDRDNCPDVPNADQANEDGDAFGDVCDPCPPIPDANPPVDSDHDGVSDACDPHPTTPGDRIALFEGFHDGVPVGWTTGGTIFGSGDGLTFTTTPGADGFTIATVPRPTGTGAATTGEQVMTAMTVLRLDGSGTVSGEILEPAQLQPTLTGLGCELVQFAGSAQESGLIDLESGAEESVAPFTYGVGDTAELAARRDSTGYRCRVELDGNFATTSGDDGSADAIIEPVLGLRVHGADASFAWFLVVEF